VGALREELETIARQDVFKYVTSSLLGFMCNHFFEEYAALQALLEEHSMLHALFVERPMSQTGSRAPSQNLLEVPVGQLHRASGAHEDGCHLSLRESGVRHLPQASVQPPLAAPLAISPVIPDLPLAKHQLPRVVLQLARVFGRAETFVIVFSVAGTLAALGSVWTGNDTRAAGPFDRVEAATVVPSASSRRSESVSAEPVSVTGAPRAPRTVGLWVDWQNITFDPFRKLDPETMFQLPGTWGRIASAIVQRAPWLACGEVVVFARATGARAA
jgi:hypothetical protein